MLFRSEVIAAAVLHDMQTGPFGHSMQYVLEDNAPAGTFIHEDLSHGWRSTYHQHVLAGATFAGRPFAAPAFLGARWDNVAKIIRGEGRFGPLIAGTMDLDNIDNVVRLAYHVGVADRSDCVIPLSLAADMDVIDGQISLSPSSVESVVRWQAIRRRLYELLLLDWAEFSAKAMLTRAIERASSKQLIGPDTWVRTDSEFLHFLERSTVGEAQEVGDMVRRLRRGELYEPVRLLRTSSVNLYSTLNAISAKGEIEKTVLNAASVKGVKLLVHFILDKGKTDRQISFIDRYSGDQRIIGKSSSQLLCGAFISTGKLSEAERALLGIQFEQLLRDHGAIDIEDLEDPMEEESFPAQPSLL